MKSKDKRKKITSKNHILYRGQQKKIFIAIIAAGIALLLFMVVIKQYVLPSQMETKIPLQTVTSLPTKTVLSPTPIPTIVLPSPTIVYVTPTVTITPTPINSPTPGQLGFDVGDSAHVTIARGTCANAFNVTPKGSTAFHLDAYPDSPIVHWKTASFTLQNQEPVDIYMCVNEDSKACDETIGDQVTLHDDTTQAIKKFWVYAKVSC